MENKTHCTLICVCLVIHAKYNFAQFEACDRILKYISFSRVRRGRDRMVAGFITTYTISANYL